MRTPTVPSAIRTLDAAASTRRGFTIIELLIVVIIIGILAAIAIPKFRNTKGRANFAALKSDLRNIVNAQETFYYENRRYTTSLDSLSFEPSRGVVLTISEVTTDGFSASAYHPDSWPRICALFIGSATPIPPATSSGVVACQ